MTYSKLLTLGTVAAIALTVSPAHAEPYTSQHGERTAGFTSHHLVEKAPYKQKAEMLPADDKLELREYLDYETREPCQFYQPIPQGFIKDGCHLRPAQQNTAKTVTHVTAATVQISNVLSDYEINFAFDSANIEPAAGETLDQIASEIKQYNPGEVTVAGFTDKAGPNDYNVKLSEKRAEAVSEALTSRGVENRILDKEAYGETRPAIDTRDGVALRENRRVMVEFLK
ncbi:MAG: hypothetical protein CMH27_04805 [Micavibrio sp.]|nr:hypothetical protein [Micavibrio sp.]